MQVETLSIVVTAAATVATALIAAAANPLGAAGTCRTAEAAEASAHRRSIDVPCAASRATGRARL